VIAASQPLPDAQRKELSASVGLDSLSGARHFLDHPLETRHGLCGCRAGIEAEPAIRICAYLRYLRLEKPGSACICGICG
jgi:hypothetical protein